MNKNSGIYALYWWGQDLVYIGLSQDLTIRKTDHYSLMRKNNHTNYKVQNAYDKYGEPEFIVLEYCSISELPQKEIEWCSEFNALGPSGLCLVEPGVVGFGPNSSGAKYSKIQILKVFSLLYKGRLNCAEITKKLDINKYLAYKVANGVSHLWLKESYPEKYAVMISNNKLRHSGASNSSSKYSKVQILKIFSLLYKSNISYEEISKKLKINRHVPYSIAKGKSHLWLKETYPEKYSIMRALRNKPIIGYIKSPSGNIYSIVTAREFVRLNINLFNTSMATEDNIARSISALIRGARSTYLGWTKVV